MRQLLNLFGLGILIIVVANVAVRSFCSEHFAIGVGHTVDVAYAAVTFSEWPAHDLNPHPYPAVGSGTYWEEVREWDKVDESINFWSIGSKLVVLAVSAVAVAAAIASVIELVVKH